MKTLQQLAAAVEARLQLFAAVDLGKTNDYGGCCDIATPSTPYYPSLYVSDRKDSKLSDIPAKGKAVIEYRLRSKSVNYAKDGTETHSSDIEVQSIDPRTNLEAVLDRYEFALQEVPDGCEVRPKRGLIGKTVRGGLMATGAYTVARKLAKKHFARGDQLASMIGAKVVPLRKGGKLAADLAGRMKKVRGIEKVKAPALRAALEPNKDKILKGMKGDLRTEKAYRTGAFNEARELWKGSIGTRLPNGALAEGRRAYGLEDVLARYEFGSGGQLKLRRAIGSLQKQGQMGKAKKLVKRVLAGESHASVFRDSIPAGVDRNTLIASKMKEAAAWGRVNHGFDSILSRYDFGSGSTGKLVRKIVAIDKKEARVLTGHFRNGIINVPEYVGTRGQSTAALKKRLKYKASDSYARSFLPPVQGPQRMAKNGVPGKVPLLNPNRTRQSMTKAGYVDLPKGFDAILARYEFADRARNEAGQFAPGNDVSVGDMADAYGKKAKKAALIVGAGGATVAAALAGKKYAPQMAGNIAPAIGRVLRRAVM